MGLQNATLVTGGTLSVAGGTTKTFTTDGKTIVNGAHFVDAAVTDYKVRPEITARVKSPVQDTLGNWSKGSHELVVKMPKVSALGKIIACLVRVDIEWHPDQSVAELDDMCAIAAQTLFDADFTSFRRTGSLA